MIRTLADQTPIRRFLPQEAHRFAPHRWRLAPFSLSSRSHQAQRRLPRLRCRERTLSSFRRTPCWGSWVLVGRGRQCEDGAAGDEASDGEVPVGSEFQRAEASVSAMDKIGIERVEEQSKRRSGGSSDDSMSKTAGELEVLTGMCFWMGREVEALQRENQSMKEWIEELRLGGGGRASLEIEIPDRKPVEIAEGSSGFDRWRKTKNGGGEDRKAEAKPGGAASGASANDVEEELRRALNAAAA